MSEGRFSNLEFEDTRNPPQEQEAHFAKEKDAAHYMSLADKAESAGEKDKALKFFSAALGEDPLLLDAWLGQLVMLLSMQEYPEAQVWSDKALEMFPDNPQISAAKATALFHVGHETQARQLIDFASEAKGDFFIVWLCRGEILLAQKIPAGESCLEHALRVAKKNDHAQTRVGEILLCNKKFSSALALLQEAVTSEPGSAWAWFLLAKTQQELGMYHKALVSVRQAVQLAPANPAIKESAIDSGTLINLFRRIFGR